MKRILKEKYIRSYGFVILVYFIIFSIFGEGQWSLFIVSLIFALVLVFILEVIWCLLAPTEDIKD